MKKVLKLKLSVVSIQLVDYLNFQSIFRRFFRFSEISEDFPNVQSIFRAFSRFCDALNFQSIFQIFSRFSEFSVNFPNF